MAVAIDATRQDILSVRIDRMRCVLNAAGERLNFSVAHTDIASENVRGRGDRAVTNDQIELIHGEYLRPRWVGGIRGVAPSGQTFCRKSGPATPTAGQSTAWAKVAGT